MFAFVNIYSSVTHYKYFINLTPFKLHVKIIKFNKGGTCFSLWPYSGSFL